MVPQCLLCGRTFVAHVVFLTYIIVCQISTCDHSCMCKLIVYMQKAHIWIKPNEGIGSFTIGMSQNIKHNTYDEQVMSIWNPQTYEICSSLLIFFNILFPTNYSPQQFPELIHKSEKWNSQNITPQIIDWLTEWNEHWPIFVCFKLWKWIRLEFVEILHFKSWIYI